MTGFVVQGHIGFFFFFLNKSLMLTKVAFIWLNTGGKCNCEVLLQYVVMIFTVKTVTVK